MYKKYILTGIISIIPVYITYWIIEQIFLIVSIPGKNIISYFTSLFNLSNDINIKLITITEYMLGFILTIMFLFFLGLIISNVVGKKIYSYFETLLNSIPIVNKVYSSIKQIISTISIDNKKSFKKVVMIQYPRKGLWTIAMVTGESTNKNKKEFYTLFVPSTPNPTTGYMIIISKEDVVNTNLSVEDATKVILSGGLVTPNLDKIP
tara:strand:- start:128 stop:748 length:621 start_codon:yes stop_codon:yes gene_type:complete